MSAEAEYIMWRVEQGWITFGSESVIPAVLLEGSTQRSHTVRQAKLVTDKLRAACQQLGMEQDWDEADARFQSGFVDLAEHQRSHCQFQVEVAVQLLRQLETAFSLISNCPGDVKEVAKQRKLQRDRVTAWLNKWSLWGTSLHAFCLKHRLDVPIPADHSADEELTRAAIARQFPWREQDGVPPGAYFCSHRSPCMLLGACLTWPPWLRHGSGLAGAAQTLAACLARAGEREARCNEEVGLIQDEFWAAAAAARSLQ